jgi:hypothetical protein
MSHRPLIALIVLTLGMAVLVGCGGCEPARPVSSPQPAASAPSPPAPLPPAGKATEPVQPPSPVVNAPPGPAPLAPAPKAPPPVQKKAAVGAGEKGHYDSNVIISPIVTPITSYFAMRERLAYDIQIPEAMKLFKATEDRAPKSQEEFMERIIKENHIVLPLLPEGHRYIYDPKRGELMIEQPGR